MGRFTEWHNGHGAGKHGKDCYTQLAKYEDTGLTPEQIIKMSDFYEAKCRELAILQKQVEESAFPCQIGQKVYIISGNTTKIIDGEVVSIRIGAVTSSLRIYIPSSKQHVNRAFEQVGKSVFFTEAAAKEMAAKGSRRQHKSYAKTDGYF